MVALAGELGTCRGTLDAFGIGDEVQSIVGPDVTGNTPQDRGQWSSRSRADPFARFPWAGGILKNSNSHLVFAAAVDDEFKILPRKSDHLPTNAGRGG